jgi:hypothetical protein
MFNNSDRDNNKEAGHTRSGRAFKEVPLANLFKHNYRDEGFYSGEEEYMTDEENLEYARAEEGKDEGPHREDKETLGTTLTIEVSTIIPLVVSVTLSNQIN